MIELDVRNEWKDKKWMERGKNLNCNDDGKRKRTVQEVSGYKFDPNLVTFS